jgi:hypothetical protein
VHLIADSKSSSFVPSRLISLHALIFDMKLSNGLSADAGKLTDHA